MIGQQAPYGVCSGILQASDAEDKENVCPENNTDWLHKNYNYVRTRQPTSHNAINQTNAHLQEIRRLPCIQFHEIMGWCKIATDQHCKHIFSNYIPYTT